MSESSEADRDLAALFESVTGRSTITERQEEAIPVRTLDEGEQDAATVSLDDGLTDAIGNSSADATDLDG